MSNSTTAPLLVVSTTQVLQRTTTQVPQQTTPLVLQTTPAVFQTTTQVLPQTTLPVLQQNTTQPIVQQTTSDIPTPTAVSAIISDTPLPPQTQTTADLFQTTPVVVSTPDMSFYTTPLVLPAFTTAPSTTRTTLTTTLASFTTIKALVATQTPAAIAAGASSFFTDIGKKEASLGTAVIAVILFLLLVGFVVFECISKIAKPHSTVNLTRLTGAMSAAIIGVFILCIGDSTFIGSNTVDLTSTYARILGLALFEGSLCFCLIIGANPLLIRSRTHTLIQSLAVGASVVCGLSIFSIVAMLILPAKPVSGPMEVAKYAMLVNQAVAIVVTLLYTYLLLRRLATKLKNPRGNEEQLANNGLFVNGTAALGLGVSILTLFAEVDSCKILLTLVSRIFLLLATFGLVSMKLAYNRGLVRRVGGKLIYSRGYSISGSEELDGLTHGGKPKAGVGAMA